MQSSDCQPSHIDGLLNVDGEKYHSAHYQRLNGKDPCDCSQTEIRACMKGESFTCSPTKSGYCNSLDGSFFGTLPADKGTCRCDGHFAKDATRTSRTKYGACQDLSSSKDHFCAFSPDDCEGNHTWVEPELAKDIVGTDCFCENVRIGGCIGGFTGFICATAKDQQCPYDRFYPPYSLKVFNGQICNLCKAPAPIEIVDELTDLPQKKSGLSSIGIAVIVVPCVIVIIVGVGVAILGFKRSRSGSKQAEPSVEVVSPTQAVSNVP